MLSLAIGFIGLGFPCVLSFLLGPLLLLKASLGAFP